MYNINNNNGIIIRMACMIMMAIFLVIILPVHSFQLPIQTAGDYKSAAIEKSNAGNLDGAILDFRRAVELDPYDAMGYNNLGVALMRHGVDNGNIKELKESAKLFKRSLSLKRDGNTADNLQLAKNYIRDIGGSSNSKNKKINSGEISADGEWDDEDDDMLDDDNDMDDNDDDDDGDNNNNRNKNNNKNSRRSSSSSSSRKRNKKNKFKILKRQINELCTDENIRLKISNKEREEGILKFKKFKRGLKILKICGVLVLEKLFTRALMKKMKKAQSKIVDTYLETIAEDPTNTNTTSSEQRSPGRYELVNPLKTPFSDKEFVSNTLFMPMMQNILGTKRLEIDTHSSVTSLGNTPQQHWHRDAGFLFDYANLQKQVPPHGMVLFVPLVKVTEEMGPTEFLSGSHIQCPNSEKEQRQLGNWILNECRHSGKTLTTPAPTGSAVIFDLRILHRGTANTTPKRRPLMYLTIFQEWFVDHVNFNDKQTSTFDQIPPNLKKLLGRMDTKEYTLLLENTLENLGVDVEAMQSNYLFRKHSFD